MVLNPVVYFGKTLEREKVVQIYPGLLILTFK